MKGLHSKMDNGATVSDWLGTAAVAAQAAATRITMVRTGETIEQTTEALSQAEDELQRALDELFAVRRHLAHLNAFGS